MTFDCSLEQHLLAGVSLSDSMLKRVRLVRSRFTNERLCALGRWIHEDQAPWDDSPELHQLKLAHASFHTIALIIEISITQGRLAEAAAMLEPDALFESATRMLAHAMSRFEMRPGVGGTAAPHGLIH
ncbi:Chemoreceptor zinc-binding domain-containing protein [Burkholderia sp. OK233]|nr:Chemoreceptor zinc-binding domain-containing protein [Burkholderia sp. OK233]